MNQYESEVIAENLYNIGFKRANKENAELIIVKACAVTLEAERKVIRFVRSVLKKKIKVWVVGCFTHFLIEKLDHSNIEFFTNYDIREKFGIKNEKIKEFFGHTRAFLKIQDGCNSYCSYCIIPRLRNKLECKSPELVKEEFIELLEQGFKEIVITGINIGLYGNKKLCKLLEDLNSLKGDFRIRLGSLDPRDITETLSNSFYGHVMPHIHLSLQSGSDNIIKLMNRKYSSSDILKKISLMRQINDKFEFTADVIVGFPKETEYDFEETIRVVKESEFSHIHIFPFSSRPGTKAFEMKPISPKIIKKRVERLKIIRDEFHKKRCEKYIGETLKILVEEKRGDFFSGLTENYIRVYFKGYAKRNTFINVKIIGIFNGELLGKIID